MSEIPADITDPMSEMPADIADPNRLAETGEWLVRCDTGDEFLARGLSAPNEGIRNDA